ncbi:MAG TPA: TonB-dependent receptor [Methylocella sp.]|nr:TonB-dependent receptor [Methylocella sp.]
MRRIAGLSGILGLGGVLWSSGTTLSLAQSAPHAEFELPEVEVVATSPLPGSGEEADKIPAMVQTVPAEDFARTNSPNVTDTLQQQIGGAVAIDINGNDFEQDLRYRGFVASAVQGTPQGLAVYQNGIRVNEAFGDTVNWDLISPQAIYSATMFTNNPLFGLNALGGAVSLQMKNGYLWQGFYTQVMGGSYGRVSGQFEYGKQIDDYSLYVTGDATHDDGWRYFSPSSLFRLYGDLGYRIPGNELHFIASGASNNVGIVGATPILLIDSNYRSVYTSPQYSLNQMGSFAFTDKFNVNKDWTVQSNFYLRSFYQAHVDGNDASIQDCSLLPQYGLPAGPAGNLCDTNNGSFIINQQGQVVASTGAVNFPYGTIDRTWVHGNTVGTLLQATGTGKVFDHDNYLNFGGSVDRSWLSYSANATLGVMQPNFVIVNGSIPGGGQIIQDQSLTDYISTYITGTATYYGLFALDTLNLAPGLDFTAGGRLNIAEITTQDATGTAPQLNADNNFTRLNPVVGLTYKFLPNLTGYAGYSEANRAPTPLELNCSSSTRPCILASTLISDPPLQQVVSHTIETGLRGNFTIPDGGALNWKAGLYRTASTNDIIQLASVVLGTGYFTNVPETLRQGVEAQANLSLGAFSAYINWAYVDATYQFSGTLSSPFNPFANANGDIFVHPGDHIPGIPRQQLKVGGDYQFTPQFKAGFDVLLVGSQYYVGDDSNQNPQLPMYWVANLHASYQLDKNVQFFGLINNLFNNHYLVYGTFFDQTTDARFAGNPVNFAADPRTITPAQPIALYGGVKVTF